MRAIDCGELEKRISSLARLARSDAKKSLLGRVLYIVENMPTLTPPEIVYCQDCVYHEDGYAHWCNKWERTCPDDSEFFCKYGRKKDGKSD